MNSDEVAKYGLARVLGFYVANPIYAPIGTYAVIKLFQNPFTRGFMWETTKHAGRATGSMLWNQSKITFEYLVKPAAKEVASKATQRYIQSRAALQVGKWGFGMGLAGAALSLIAIGVVIASGKGQSGIQMAEGQKEYEEHAIRSQGIGRGVVI